MTKKQIAGIYEVNFSLLEENEEFFIYAEKGEKGIKIPIECNNIESDVAISILTSDEGLQEIRFANAKGKELAKATIEGDKIVFEKKEIISRTISF